MAHVRPEFFYHPAVGVIAPASLGLFAFKQTSPTVVNASPLSSITPKPLVRVYTPLPETEAVEPEAIPDMKKFATKIPKGERTEICIVSGEELPVSQMIRFVVDPENNIVADLAEKLPGIGYWVKADRELLKKAVWRNSFTTAARTPVNVAKNLAETVAIGLLRQSLETIALARKAGLITAGFAKCEEVLAANKAVLYVVANDAKENGREKLERMAKEIPVLDIWTSSQLSAALGEDNAVHVVLNHGGLTDKLLNIAHKLKEIR